MAALRVLARKRAAERPPQPFIEFLQHVHVRSDDPSHPIVTRWQPWPYLIERAEAWAAGRSEVNLKTRQIGWSWLLAAYYAWRARQGWAIGHISAGQLEARALLSRVSFIEQHLPPDMRIAAQFLADEAKYPGGGVLHAFPSTDHAGISFTFQLVGMDEAAFHPYGSANYAAIRPTVSAGGQFLIGSTADPSLGPSGFMFDMYWASKRGETGYNAVFIPWYVRPGRDAAWIARERAAFTGLEEEFDAYYPETDSAAFVGRSGLVYAMFDERIHVVSYHPHPWEQTKMRVGGVDFGGGDPTVAMALGMAPNRGIHQFSEYYKRGAVSAEEIGAFFAPIHKLRPFASIECDPSGPTAIASLVAMGLPAVAADNKRSAIGLTASLLEQRRLTIHESCKGSIGEFPGYHWAERVDPHDHQRYATKTPFDHHGDGMDARRYALKRMIDWEESLGPVLPRTTIGGMAIATRAV